MRIVKDADERKNEILDIAGELFAQKGFDGTSTNDILERVGIARGTLYYHFKSKEDILDALINRITMHIIATAKVIASNKELSVNERIIKVVMSLNMSNQEIGKALIEQMHKPQNALMHQKSQKSLLRGVTPILANIVVDGVEQGVYNTPFPYECMEMIMVYANIVFDDDDMLELTQGERAQRTMAFVYNTEKLLGVESGVLTPTIMSMLGGDN